ncbi:putative WD repeat domain 34 [Operophtera brumata]|uniref:Putative WD repeat domain 34 n=1 Tax=Operophtera brumata TaxID=104452 RepID=A0A0L7LTN1_OPEBR|nr:putative WD repeat domain 34 [Operophtera brumata]
MSNLSSYDSEAVGFDSVSSKKRAGTSCSTQTSGFNESGVSSQTNLSKSCGTMATPEELNAQDDILKEYPPPGLTEFLRRVVPAMIEQLDEDDKEVYGSSDSEEEETITAKLFQEIRVADCNGAGDQATSVLALSWSSAGNSLAVSTGKLQHENWCTHDGLIRIYTVKRTAGDKLVHLMDVTEKNCVSAVKYHPSLSTILAYGTTSGEVVMCNLGESGNLEEMQLASPSGCHGSKRVSALQWADSPLANTYLTMQINNTGKRRGASDQILFSSGSDGTLNVWQVNAYLKIFEIVVSYVVNGSRKVAAPDITCFDFIKCCPLRPSDERVPGDIFVVGTKSGTLFVCKIKPPQQLERPDPVYEVLEGHRTCVLNVAFSFQKPGIFISASIDSELRVYDISQACPLKVLQIESPISCVCWLPRQPGVCVLGLSPGGAMLYNASCGRRVPVDGLAGGASSAVAAEQSGSCRIACGDAEGRVRVWELPPRRMRCVPDDLDF